MEAICIKCGRYFHKVSSPGQWTEYQLICTNCWTAMIGTKK